MEVLQARCGLLTNAEVLALCNEYKEKNAGKGHAFGGRNFNTILFETKHYLQRTPCVNQTKENAVALAEALKDFKLTKAEFLQILNLRPSTPVEIQLIVEECEERLSEEQVDKLIEFVGEHLPPAPSLADK